jgi:hypothetical protein
MHMSYPGLSSKTDENVLPEEEDEGHSFDGSDSWLYPGHYDPVYAEVITLSNVPLCWESKCRVLQQE